MSNADAREMRLLPNSRKEAAKYKAVFPSGGVPWSLLAPHEEQAMQNHGQTLERLSERGGLGPDEMLSIVKDRRYARVSDDEALAQLKALVEAAEPTPQPAVKYKPCQHGRTDRWCCGTEEDTQPAPSGDEAKVREILDRTGWFFEVPRDKAQLVGHDEVLGLLHEAHAAGKADGARCPNCDHSDVSHGDRGCKRVVLSITTRPQWCPCHLSQTKVLDAIARRGSEGK